MTSTRKSANERKKQIMDAALRLFSSSSYNSIIMDDIAKACNIARTTLYEYYSNKEDILIALVEDSALKARRIKLTGVTCKEQLEFLAAELLDWIQKNRIIYGILFQATPVMSEKLASKFLKWREQNFYQVKEVAESGKKSGELRGSISADDASFAFQAFIGQRAGELIMRSEESNSKTEAKRLMNILWSGIGGQT